MEPQSLADTSHHLMQPADERSATAPEPVAKAVPRLREAVLFARFREAAQPAGADSLIADPTGDVGRDQRRVAISTGETRTKLL